MIEFDKSYSCINLAEKIKSNKYERLDDNIKSKLVDKEESRVDDFIKNPIIIKNNNNYDVVSEKILQKLTLEDIEDFMSELLGNSFIQQKNINYYKSNDMLKVNKYKFYFLSNNIY